MARKDRRILEEFVKYICESEDLPVINIQYLSFGLTLIDKIVMFPHGIFECKKELALVFNTDYMYETHYDTILHELGHYHHYHELGEEGFRSLDKKTREEKAEAFADQKFSTYREYYQTLVKKHKPRHEYLKSLLLSGLHLWVRGYPDMKFSEYYEVDSGEIDKYIKPVE